MELLKTYANTIEKEKTYIVKNMSGRCLMLRDKNNKPLMLTTSDSKTFAINETMFNLCKETLSFSFDVEYASIYKLRRKKD